MALNRRRVRGGSAGATPGSDADQDLAGRSRPELSGQARLDAQRGYRPEPEQRRPEPQWSRNDPERPIGYDPERWAGFEPEDLIGGGGGDGGGEPEVPADSLRRTGGGSRRQGGQRFGERTGLSGERAGASSKRRSGRPKQPRPQPTPQERAQRTTQRRERSAAAVAADPIAAAKAIALRQLALGPRTRAQLRAAMARKEIPEDVAIAVLDRFEEVNLVDDPEFARQWVQSRHLGRGLAPRALAYELRQRGIAEETVKGAVESLTPDDELAAARDLVRRKAVTIRDDDPQRRIRRLAGMLARKGYGGGVAMQAIRAELAELAEQDEESDPADLADLAQLDFAEVEDPGLG